MKKKIEIDVSTDIINKNDAFGISGRKTGQIQRRKKQIDLIEKKYDEIVIIVPENFYYASSSFFLGLLGKSVRKCGSREAFLNKFKFKCTEDVLLSVEEGIKDALRKGNGLN